MEQCGVPVDLSKVKVLVYILASREDHIAPWKTAYRSKDLIGENARFVRQQAATSQALSIRQRATKRSLNDNLASEPEHWFDGPQETPGSWWPDWDAWMKRHSRGIVPAPAQLGNAQYPPIEPAPGRYVKLSQISHG